MVARWVTQWVTNWVVAPVLRSAQVSLARPVVLPVHTKAAVPKPPLVVVSALPVVR
ncbi:hypothetical protein D3C81_2323130 [compost metagenome]